MRNLTITRTKTFVGCLGHLKVYIEDELGDTVINGNKCRLLGKIKNNTTETYEIDEQERRVYVIADKLSKGYCNDSALVPAGQQNVYLSGCPRYNPATGHAFRFDGQADEVAMKSRRKGTVIGVVVLVVAFIVGLVASLIANGVFDGPGEPKEFTHNGMTILLTDKFEQEAASVSDGEFYDTLFSSDYVAVFVDHTAFSEDLIEKDATLTDFAKMIMEANDMPLDTEIKTADGLTWFEDKYVSGGTLLHDFTMVYKTGDAFWLLQFVVYEEDIEEYRPMIMEWAGSVRFNQTIVAQ